MSQGRQLSYVTHQKVVLGELLERSEHPLTAHDLWEKAQEILPNLGIATVYRALRQFKEEGLVRAVEIPGVTPHYESAHHHHHHFFLCQQCERLFHIEGCLADIDTLAPENFEVEYHEIILYGNCKSCLEEE